MSVVYGQMLVGSQVISANIENKQVGGDDEEDDESLLRTEERIYRRTINDTPPPRVRTTEEQREESNYVPEGWTEQPQGLIGFSYEWVCVRTRRPESEVWSEFSAPVIYQQVGPG